MKKGDKITMYFHLIGLISEEDFTINKVHKDGSVTLSNGYRFDTKTGKCLNDNTDMGASRSIKGTNPSVDFYSTRGEDETCGEE